MAVRESLLRRSHFCWSASTRTKTSRLQVPTDQEANDDAGGLSGFLELTSIAVATSLPVAVLVVAGQIVKDVAGPSTILAVLLGAVCAAIVGLSFCEISSKSWKALQIGAYEYVYRSGSEAAAFLIAWLLLLHHCVISGLTSRAISENIDMLLGNRVSNYSAREFGRLEIFDSGVDLVALLLSLLALVLAAGSVSLPCRKRTSAIFFNCSLIAAVMFVCVVAIYHLEWKNWSTANKFFPGGANGVLSGAATTYFLFAVDGVIVPGRDTSSQSKRRRLIASFLTSNGVASFILISVTSAMTLLLRHPTSFGGCPLAEAYVSAGVVWMNYFLCPVSIVLLLPSLCTRMNRAADVIHDVAEDGLLMRVFRRSLAPDDLRAPSVWSCIGAGTISSVGAMILNLTTLSQLASATIICVHFVVIVDVMTVRFRPQNKDRKSTVRRSRTRERNGRESGLNRKSDSSCYGTTSSLNVGANGMNHPEASSHPLLPATTEDYHRREEEAGWSTETDYVNDDVSSSDTDIDDVVDEYLQTTYRNERTADDSLLDFRCATDDSYRKSIRLLAAFITSGLVFAAVVCRLTWSSVTNRAIIGIVTFVWLAVTSLCAVRLLRLPRNEPGTRLLPFFDPIRLCGALVAILVVCCLANLFRGLTTILLLIWIILGCFLYFGYGIHHSQASRDVIILPEEERGLIGREETQEEDVTCPRQHQAPPLEAIPS